MEITDVDAAAVVAVVAVVAVAVVVDVAVVAVAVVVGAADVEADVAVVDYTAILLSLLLQPQLLALLLLLAPMKHLSQKNAPRQKQPNTTLDGSSEQFLTKGSAQEH